MSAVGAVGVGKGGGGGGHGARWPGPPRRRGGGRGGGGRGSPAPGGRGGRTATQPGSTAAPLRPRSLIGLLAEGKGETLGDERLVPRGIQQTPKQRLNHTCPILGGTPPRECPYLTLLGFLGRQGGGVLGTGLFVISPKGLQIGGPLEPFLPQQRSSWHGGRGGGHGE